MPEAGLGLFPHLEIENAVCSFFSPSDHFKSHSVIGAAALSKTKS